METPHPLPSRKTPPDAPRSAAPLDQSQPARYPTRKPQTLLENVLRSTSWYFFKAEVSQASFSKSSRQPAGACECVGPPGQEGPGADWAEPGMASSPTARETPPPPHPPSHATAHAVHRYTHARPQHSRVYTPGANAQTKQRAAHRCAEVQAAAHTQGVNRPAMHSCRVPSLEGVPTHTCQSPSHSHFMPPSPRPSRRCPTRPLSPWVTPYSWHRRSAVSTAPQAPASRPPGRRRWPAASAPRRRLPRHPHQVISQSAHS